MFRMMLLALSILALQACSGEIYLRDGITDGDTFYLAERAYTDDDPVLQSWVSYSLARSTCQLALGGENPARASSFRCELDARLMLLDTWSAQKREHGAISDRYLDALAGAQDAGYLPEYVAMHFGEPHWTVPGDLDVEAYKRWAARNLPRHRPQTRWVGSWNYARNVRTF